MKPLKSEISDSQKNLFRTELAQIIDSEHSLVKLAGSVAWDSLDEEFGAHFCADTGRPGVPTRLMVALHYLKYTYDLSDAKVLEGWLENPYWQYLSGMKWFAHEFPTDSSNMTRWRKRIGFEGAEKLLRETINAGMTLQVIKASQLKRVNIDTTVQEKAIRFPTDARLYDRVRERLVKEAEKLQIRLRQKYTRVSKHALLKQSRYAHARQMKRANRETRRLKTFLGRVIRDIERKVPCPGFDLGNLLIIGKRIFSQQKTDKNKIYSVHEPQVECISKGKAHKRYEFGCKVSVAVTSRGGWFVGAKAVHGNPYDGHTLSEAIEQMEKIAVRPEHVFVDRGYRGHGYEGDITVHVDKERRGKTSKSLWLWMKRRAAVEPSIGHLKQEHRLERNRLKGRRGDSINVILSAAGMNFRKLIRRLADFFVFVPDWPICAFFSDKSYCMPALFDYIFACRAKSTSWPIISEI
jgi:IS5 family transposase